MRKAVRNCRNLNMQTIRLRRSRPSSLSVALALAVTMFIVWVLSLQGCPKEAAAAASSLSGSAEISMERIEVQFLLSSVHDDRTQANVAAALCARSGGAGLVIEENGSFAVVQEAGENFAGAEAPVARRSAPGLTLKLEGRADTIAAVKDGLSALRALAEETGPLAASLQSGAADTNAVCALLGVYKTQLENAAAALAEQADPSAALIKAAMDKSIPRLASAMENPAPGEIRLLQASGCADWVDLARELRSAAA